MSVQSTFLEVSVPVKCKLQVAHYNMRGAAGGVLVSGTREHTYTPSKQQPPKTPVLVNRYHSSLTN